METLKLLSLPESVLFLGASVKTCVIVPRTLEGSSRSNGCSIFMGGRQNKRGLIQGEGSSNHWDTSSVR